MAYDTLASTDVVEKTIAGLKARNMEGVAIGTKAEALEKIKELIPAGASVMNGSSQTLEEIGFIEYLKQGNHGWNNLHKGIIEEQDPAKKAELRRQSVLSDYYLGSVHAMTEDGELVIASASGSQMPHLVYTSPNLILVVSTKKIMPNLDEAMERLTEYVLPLENERATRVYGGPTSLNQMLIMKGEMPMTGRKIHVLFVNESLGY